MRFRFISVGSYRARVLEAGEGPPLLLIPSMLIRAEAYRPLVRVLARRFRVLVVEIPGSGRSSRIDGVWSFERCARFVCACIEELGLARPVVVGHSNSGPVALLVGARDALCRAVIAVDTVGVRRRGGLIHIALGRCIDALREVRLNLRASWQLLYNLVRHFRNCVHQLRSTRGTFAYQMARACHAPLLLAWGRADRTMPLRDAQALAESLSNAELVVHRGSHDWLIVKARGFLRVLDAFVSSSAASAPSFRY